MPPRPAGGTPALLFALRWETHAATGDGLRSDCGNYEEIDQDGDRRGLSQIALARRCQRVRGLSFGAGLSGLGRDHPAGWRTSALADCGGVVGKRGSPVDWRL